MNEAWEDLKKSKEPPSTCTQCDIYSYRAEHGGKNCPYWTSHGDGCSTCPKFK